MEEKVKRLYTVGCLSPLLFLFGCGGGSTTPTVENSCYLSTATVPATFPTISSLTASPDAHTIVATWTTASLSSSSLACGTVSGSRTINAVDNGIQMGVCAHENVVEGLTPSTLYYCQASSTNAEGTAMQTFTATTTALPSTTAIISLTLGTITSYNSINENNQGCADTYYNAHSNNGTTYFTVDDVTCGAYKESGVPAWTAEAPMSVAEFTSESPLAAISINNLTAYCCSGSNPPDGLDAKDQGLFAMDGMLFMTIAREGWGPFPYYTLSDGQIIWSPDHGATWNNFQEPGTFEPNGNPTSPLNASMWGSTGSSTFAAATFVMYCGDDGTLGYLCPCNREDNANAFVYLISNEGINYAGSTNGSNGKGAYLYLGRIPRAKLAHLNPSDIQYFSGGDGSQDANWSSSYSSAVAMVTNYASISQPAVQYIPALNRYLLLTYSAPDGIARPSISQWLGYEAPHPWGPWTLIYTASWTGSTTPPGAYNPIILNDTAWTGTTPTVLFTGDFETSAYQMYFATLTIN